MGRVMLCLPEQWAGDLTRTSSCQSCNGLHLLLQLHAAQGMPSLEVGQVQLTNSIRLALFEICPVSFM